MLQFLLLLYIMLIDSLFKKKKKESLWGVKGIFTFNQRRYLGLHKIYKEKDPWNNLYKFWSFIRLCQLIVRFKHLQTVFSISSRVLTTRAKCSHRSIWFLRVSIALTARAAETHTANPRVSCLPLLQHYYNDTQLTLTRCITVYSCINGISVLNCIW